MYLAQDNLARGFSLGLFALRRYTWLRTTFPGRKGWRRGWESNPRMEVLQTSPLNHLGTAPHHFQFSKTCGKLRTNRCRPRQLPEERTTGAVPQALANRAGQWLPGSRGWPDSPYPR